MKKCIRFYSRRNIFYLTQLVMHYYLRKINLIVINQLYEFNDSLIFTFLMLLGEFFAGLSIYLYQIYFFKNKNVKNAEYFGIKLITRESKMKRPDSYKKIILLIFFTSCFDFMEFVLETFYLPKIEKVSPSANVRLGGVIIIFSSLLCYFNLRLKIFRHQFISLIAIGFCLILIITFEIIFGGKGIPAKEFSLAYFFVFLYLVFVTFTDVVEKYLLEIDLMNPFITLILESIFGLILVLIYSYGENPFKDIANIYEQKSSGEFALLIFLLFLYFAFSAGVNVYKLLSNVLYSPMAKTLAVYILNPFMYIYYYTNEKDFISGEEKNFFYFLINVILAVIISFFGCVYNEFLIIYCCRLDYETHCEIASRAKSSVENLLELDCMDNDIKSEF